LILHFLEAFSEIILYSIELWLKADGDKILVFRLFWFLCGNEVYTDSFFDKIVLKVLPDKHFTIP